MQLIIKAQYRDSVGRLHVLTTDKKWFSEGFKRINGKTVDVLQPMTPATKKALGLESSKNFGGMKSILHRIQSIDLTEYLVETI